MRRIKSEDPAGWPGLSAFLQPDLIIRVGGKLLCQVILSIKLFGLCCLCGIFGFECLDRKNRGQGSVVRGKNGTGRGEAGGMEEGNMRVVPLSKARCGASGSSIPALPYELPLFLSTYPPSVSWYLRL